MKTKKMMAILLMGTVYPNPRVNISVLWYMIKNLPSWITMPIEKKPTSWYLYHPWTIIVSIPGGEIVLWIF